MIYSNLRHLHAFVVVVQLGSMIKAARRLHLGQPALSQAIANLEQLTKVKLLARTTRSLTLTPAGEVFYRDAMTVLEHNQRMFTNIGQWADARQGSVCIMSIPSVAQCLLPRVVREFGERHPQVTIDVYDLPDPLLAPRFLEGKGDIGIQTLGYQHSDARTLPVLRDPMRWLAPRHHPLAERARIRPQDIAGDTLILLRSGSVFREMVEPVLRQHPPRQRLIEVDQLSTLISMVSGGMGVSLIPALCCPPQPDAALVHRPWQDGKLARTVVLTRPAGQVLMPAHQRFVETLLQQLERDLALPEGVKWMAPAAEACRQFLNS